MDLTPEQDTEQEAAEPATPFYKTKAGIGAISAGVVVVAAAAFFAFTGGSDKEEAPDPVATASMGPVASPSPSPSGTPAESAEPTGSAEATEGTAADGETPGPQQPPATEQPSADNPAAVPGANGPIRVGDHAQGPSIGEWEPTAEAYGAAWADPSGGHSAWLERLKPHVTPEMYMAFTYTDIANITDRKLQYVILADEGVRTKDFKVYYEDGYALLAQAEIQNDGTWLVSKSMPADN